MFTPTLEQQETIDNNADKIHQLAKELWEAYNKVDYDPMCSRWDYLDDPIKDDFIAAASFLVVSVEG